MSRAKRATKKPAAPKPEALAEEGLCGWLRRNVIASNTERAEEISAALDTLENALVVVECSAGGEGAETIRAALKDADEAISEIRWVRKWIANTAHDLDVLLRDEVKGPDGTWAPAPEAPAEH